MSLITSENQIVCFPSFVLTVFWYSTSYTVIIVFWMMLMEPVDAPARWWPWACLKCISGLRRLRKILEFFEMHTCLWPGAQIWFRHKWRKLVTAYLLLRCIDWYSSCVLREVLAASKQVNLPVITGKLHVTQVNCARDLFTSELHVKLPAFAGTFARASFTVYCSKINHLNCFYFFWANWKGNRWCSNLWKLYCDVL